MYNHNKAAFLNIFVLVTLTLGNTASLNCFFRIIIETHLLNR